MTETVAFILPALDEEEALPHVLGEIERADTGAYRRHGIVVVDNGSSDATARVARLGGAAVVAEPRRGYGAACLAGMHALRRDPPDVVVFIDADGSDDPADLPALLAPIREGRADLVIGSRVRGEVQPGSLTPVQRFGNRLATLLMRILLNVRFTDLGPFRAIRWRTLESLGMRDRGYGWTVEMQARAARCGVASAEVPVACRRRVAGRSKVAGTVRGAVGAGWKILFTIARVRLGG